MKGKHIYLFFLFAFVAVIFLFEYMAPHRFTWKPTYDKNDKEPFGSFVFDDIVASSVDQYTVLDKTLYQIIEEDSTAAPRAFLLTERMIRFNKTDIEALYRLLYHGNQVMLCADNFPILLEDTLCFSLSSPNYQASIERSMKNENKRDFIYFGTDTLLPIAWYEVFPQIHPVHILLHKRKWVTVNGEGRAEIAGEGLPAAAGERLPSVAGERRAKLAGEMGDSRGVSHTPKNVEEVDSRGVSHTPKNVEEVDSRGVSHTPKNVEEVVTTSTSKFLDVPLNCDSSEILARNMTNEPLVLRAFIGKGELFIVTTPLMFTNYGMLDRNNASYTFRLLSYLKDKPIIRIEAYGDHREEPTTPLRYVLSTPTLKWAIYGSMTLLLLFMLFTAKRRQRVIPVVVSPPNRTLGFMKLISNLYYNRNRNDEILKMKQLYFSAEVKRLIGVDLQEFPPDPASYRRLSEKTGIEADELNTLIKDINMSIYRFSVSDDLLKRYMDSMNRIIQTLKL